MVVARIVDRHLGPLLVKRLAFGQQFFHRLSCPAYDSPRIQIPQALVERLKLALEVHHNGIFAKMGHRPLGIDHGTTRGDHPPMRSKPEDDALLHGKEAWNPIAIENFLERPAGFGLNHQIRIHEIPAELFGQKDSDCAFSRSGHSNEDDRLHHEVDENDRTSSTYLGLMRRALTLSMALPSLALANLGDWKLWTSVNTAHNAVARGQTILVATGGGVVEWSPTRSKQRVFTTLDGLPEINTVSVLADESGAVWAIGASGRIARLGPGASSWEATGSYAASGWTFNTAATAYWKNFLILGGSQGLSLFSTTAKVAMDNISSIQGKTVQIASALVFKDTLWVGTDKGTAYCAPDSAGWEKAGTPGHYLSDHARWHWVNNIPNTRVVLDSHSVLVAQNPNLWLDETQGLRSTQDSFRWPNGIAFIPGADHGIASPGGGFVVSSLLLGPVFVNPDATWKVMEVDGTFPYNALPTSVSVDPSGNLYALGQGYGSTVIAKRSAGANSWTLDTLKISSKDSTGKTVEIRPWWDLGETKNRARIGLDVEPSGRIAVGAWASGPTKGGLFLSGQPGKWSRIGLESDTCMHELFWDHSSIGSALYDIRARGGGLWISELRASGIEQMSGKFLPRIHFLPTESNGPLTCLDIPFLGEEFQATDLLPLDLDLWMGTEKHGVKRVAKIHSVLGNKGSPSVSSPAGASSGQIYRLERYPLEGRDWVIAAGTGILGLVDPIADTFYLAEGADQTYRALAVDSKMQIWGAGNAGIDIFKVAIEQDSSGKSTPIIQRIRRVTKNDGLPENEILDLRLDSASGKAILSTENALALWASPFRPVPKKLDASKIKVWPNPVRLLKSRTVFVDGVTENAEFNLVAQDGTLVYHLPTGRQTTGMFQIELPPSQNLRPGLYFWAVKDGNSVARGPLLVGH